MQFCIEEAFLLVDPTTGQPVEVNCVPLAGGSSDEGDADSFAFHTVEEAFEALLENRMSVRAAATAASATANGLDLTSVLAPADAPCAAATGTEGPALHTHLPAPTSEERIQVMNYLRRWLPILMALGANSPPWDGEDPGFASWPTIRNRTLPVHGVPSHLFWAPGSHRYAEAWK